MSLGDRLEQRADEGNPVRVAVVGAGQMGTGLVIQMEHLRGFHVIGIADINAERARHAFAQAGVASEQLAVVEDLDQAQRAVEAGMRVVTRDAALLASVSGGEVVVDATGVPEVGARVAVAAIGARKHVVMLNVEADITVGRALKAMADEAGVVYTGSAGDEYGATKELVEFAQTLGFTVIAAGKGKNNILDRSVTPKDQEQRAQRLGANPWMLSSFVDGTKTMVEMTCLANATGLVPDVRGMHGPDATVQTLPKIFCPQTDGGILSRAGVVDYAIGVAPGVFVIISTEQPAIADNLRYLQLGPGPYWLLFRPYHLANLETPMSVARAAIYGEATIAPGPEAVAETIAVAKRDLKAGEKLDAIGGYDYYGMIDRAEVVEREGLLPIGLAEAAVLAAPVARGEAIRRSIVQVEDTTLARLRKKQEAGAPLEPALRS
ncbi:MAG TPA: NAD(P)-dependent oxidoreductase [Candidatus Dormibacteraeota bacterium]